MNRSSEMMPTSVFTCSSSTSRAVSAALSCLRRRGRFFRVTAAVPLVPAIEAAISQSVYRASGIGKSRLGMMSVDL